MVTIIFYSKSVYWHFFWILCFGILFQKIFFLWLLSFSVPEVCTNNSCELLSVLIFYYQGIFPFMVTFAFCSKSVCWLFWWIIVWFYRRFQGNSFNGSIPSSLSNLTSLTELWVPPLVSCMVIIDWWNLIIMYDINVGG